MLSRVEERWGELMESHFLSPWGDFVEFSGFVNGKMMGGIKSGTVIITENFTIYNIFLFIYWVDLYNKLSFVFDWRYTGLKRVA